MAETKRFENGPKNEFADLNDMDVDPKLIGNKLDLASLNDIMTSLKWSNNGKYFNEDFDSEKSIV